MLTPDLRPEDLIELQQQEEPIAGEENYLHLKSGVIEKLEQGDFPFPSDSLQNPYQPSRGSVDPPLLPSFHIISAGEVWDGVEIEIPHDETSMLPSFSNEGDSLALFKIVEESPKTSHHDVQSGKLAGGSDFSQKRRRMLFDKNCRTDVVVKTILRGIRRHIAKLFVTGRRLSRRIYINPESLRENLLEQATKLGLITSNDEVEVSKEYQDFVCLLSYSRTTKSFLQAMGLENSENGSENGRAIAQAYEDILNKFTHDKLHEVCRNPCFKPILLFFQQKCESEFLDKLEPKKRDMYSKALKTIKSLCGIDELP